MTISPKFAFIKARWHADIVDQAFVGFKQHLDGLNVAATIETFDVPGAFEMPLLAQKLAETGRFDAIIAAALVVDGGIYRHDFVAQSVVTGLQSAAMTTGIPVLSVSLTPHNFQPTQEHTEFFSAHFVKKGVEAAVAAVDIVKIHSALVTGSTRLTA